MILSSGKGRNVRPYMWFMLQKLQARVHPREVSITSILLFMMW